MKKSFLWLTIIVLTVLAACSSSNNEESSENNNEGDNSERSVKIEDALGEQTIKGTPKKVVVLEWTYAEDLQALGMEPVGVAGLDSYGDWVDVGIPFSDKVEDVGTRAEPNLEAISRMDPDLIIGVKFRHEGIADQLKEIAPTIMFEPYSEESAKDQYKNMLDEFNTVAKAVDKEDKAKEVVSHMEKTFEDQKQRLADAGHKDVNYVITQAFTSQNTPTLRLFTDNSIVSHVMNKMGMQNAYESDKLETYGYTSTTVETLQNYQDSSFFYIVQDNDNIFNNQLKGNPVWEDLDFVKEGRTYKMPGDTWTFGGPLSAEVLSKQVADAMLKEDQ
ncbi:iron-siderophore ABC transporter substrate-binding protein [Halobacillus salinarum]|uniref:Iron-siderophore ABC transporter substrate-binding protein n=1 Tax=Halobacillus salinarum TaxID=2932257 RepID=A0ABY4EFQ0_9BACI|nr:iron-siderophore ABC transporter substrate-binding protein [Halobacillus salinarum]UOQ43290.1 iron-siderophore ABC transporter substrate-binding protein [Halobacillus salinarum]